MDDDAFFNHQNPYAVSEHASGAVRELVSGNIRLDGDLLVVGLKAQLPEICVVSGETQDLVNVQRKLTYVSPVVIVVFILSRVIGLILYLIMRKQTKVSFYMSRQVRRKKRWMSFLGFVMLLATIAAVIGFADVGAPGMSPWLLLIPFTMFIVSVTLLIKGNHILQVKKFQKPDEFWIKGLKLPFLEAMRSAPESNGYLHAGF